MTSTGQEHPFADVNASMFESRREFALYLDSIDPFAEYRDRFHIPRTPEGEEMTYLVGNSLCNRHLNAYTVTHAVGLPHIHLYHDLDAESHVDG